jgi:hypothetical protein
MSCSSSEEREMSMNATKLNNRKFYKKLLLKNKRGDNCCKKFKEKRASRTHSETSTKERFNRGSSKEKSSYSSSRKPIDCFDRLIKSTK